MGREEGCARSAPVGRVDDDDGNVDLSFIATQAKSAGEIARQRL